MTRETHASRANIKTRFHNGPTITHTAPTLAELWAKINAEVINQEQHGLRVACASVEIQFTGETK